LSNFLNKKYTDLQKLAQDQSQAYISADPVPNITFNDFFDPDLLGKVVAEFPDMSKEDSKSYDNPKEKKIESKGDQSFGGETKRFMDYLNSEPFLNFLQTLTEIKEILLGDPIYFGGGLHEVKNGGYLKIHADFNKHFKTNLDRRLNLLIYLNKDWKDSYGGHFELWDKEMKNCKKRVLPSFNTMTIFSTTDYSYHGHPDPLNCPKDMSRKSLALYYYSKGRPANEINPDQKEHDTLFKKRAGNDQDKIDFSKKTKLTVKEYIKRLLPSSLKKAIKFITNKK